MAFIFRLSLKASFGGLPWTSQPLIMVSGRGGAAFGAIFGIVGKSPIHLGAIFGIVEKSPIHFRQEGYGKLPFVHLDPLN